MDQSTNSVRIREMIKISDPDSSGRMLQNVCQCMHSH